MLIKDRFRHRRNARLIAALDIGASKVSCFIARRSAEDGIDGHAEIIGVGHSGLPAGQRLAQSSFDIETVIRNAVDAAERMAGERIDEVIVGAPGRFLRTRRVGVDLELAGGLVTEEDIDDSLKEGADIATEADCATLHAFPIAFKVDGETMFSDPAGLSGRSLSTEMLGVGVRQSVADNLTTLVERCNLSVSAFVAAPYAAAEATLIEDEKDLGVVVIDIGAGSTSFAVYDNGVMIDCGGAPVGGAHITKDLAQIFGAPLAQAERIKVLHGAALIGPGDENRCIDIAPLGAGGETTRVSRADVCEVIIPRMEEIFELVGAKLPDDGMQRSGLRRAVITGGGSLLIGARELAERVLLMKCRTGRPLGIGGGPEAASAPGFSVCAGLIQHSAKFGAESKSGLGVWGQSAHSGNTAAIFGGVESWFRAKF